MISKFQRSLRLKCMGFTCNGAKLFNMLPLQMRETQNPDTFQKYVKRLDMERNPFILIIFFIAFLKSVKILWIKKQIYNTIPDQGAVDDPFVVDVNEGGTGDAGDTKIKVFINVDVEQGIKINKVFVIQGLECLLNRFVRQPCH